MSPRWDPETYLRFAEERIRPFHELLARVDADPRQIVDLGCGPGQSTPVLLARWPDASVAGVDSSPEMVERARETDPDGRIDYVLDDLREWQPEAPVDLLVSAATFQWVPGHLDLLPALADSVAPDGTFAFTVPGNFDAPNHVLLRELAGREPYAPHVQDVERPDAHDAATYLAALSRPGWRVDAWETTYLHVLRGADPVLRWMAGTGARPVLQALPDDLRARFEADYAAALRRAYPPAPHGTVVPFRRVFTVATRHG